MADKFDIEKASTESSRNKKESNATVEVIMEKVPCMPSHKKFIPNHLPKNKVVAAYNPYREDQSYAQTPYYQTQNVAGQPVYVTGTPPPANASRMPTYQQRRRYSDDEQQNDPTFNVSFNDKEIRNRFVQRVYTILTVQLLFTFGLILIATFVEEVTFFMLEQFYLFYIAVGVELVLYIALVCCVSVRRNFPINFIILALFTIAFSYMMAFTTILYHTQIVMMAMGITAGVCTFISVFACICPWDITGCGMFLCLISIGIMIFGCAAMIITLLTGSTLTFMIYAGLIAVLFSLYLMYDTQMIMGGHRIELSPEEYIFGALTLYVDIMQIFWAILTIFGLSR